eukprot:gene4363-8688_t
MLGVEFLSDRMDGGDEELKVSKGSAEQRSRTNQRKQDRRFRDMTRHSAMTSDGGGEDEDVRRYQQELQYTNDLWKIIITRLLTNTSNLLYSSVLVWSTVYWFGQQAAITALFSEPYSKQISSIICLQAGYKHQKKIANQRLHISILVNSLPHEILYPQPKHNGHFPNPTPSGIQKSPPMMVEGYKTPPRKKNFGWAKCHEATRLYYNLLTTVSLLRITSTFKSLSRD